MIPSKFWIEELTTDILEGLFFLFYSIKFFSSFVEINLTYSGV